MVGKICEKGRTWAGSERERDLWMVRVVSWESKKMWQEHEQGSQRQRDWNEVDGENYEIDSRDMVRHTWRSEAYLKASHEWVGGIQIFLKNVWAELKWRLYWYNTGSNEQYQSTEKADTVTCLYEWIYWPAHVVQWVRHSDAMCGRVWCALLPLLGGSILASVRYGASAY